MRSLKIFLIFLLSIGALFSLDGQNRYELNEGWRAIPSTKIEKSGEEISNPNFSLKGWQKAVVPGTVLTTQLENGEIPDPFYGMNNEQIPDIYDVGRDYYTYWFALDFEEKVGSGEEVWLTFRGINYACEVYLNGKQVNEELFEGMFIRKSFNITSLLNSNGKNRLGVIVYPPYVVGEPNGGQGGDGRIAKNLTHQYVAGWDWIQPIRDRNTGIWDKVYIEKTGAVNLKNPHIVTLVEGERDAEGEQEPATIRVSAELQNATKRAVSGELRFTIAGEVVKKAVTLSANQTKEVALEELVLENPKLWWPSGYGEQHLYDAKVGFYVGGKCSDYEQLKVGIREIQHYWNPTTHSQEIAVNGKKIFIKGGNWIISDAMLRFSNERYDHEIRFHRDMNLNLIRIWGGALTERPEFYEACDKYGMLVIQDFWFSGDCNGRWLDPMKAEDQWTRRAYPDNHSLVLEAAEDMIKMIRNYPSLAMWCGGNEIMPPIEILEPLRDEILPRLDGTRWFIEYSNSDEWSYNFIGGNGDGPYTIQEVETFWEYRTWPFNSEVGSVGVGDYESLERFIPKENMVPPVYDPNAQFNEIVDPVWAYHTYHGVGYQHHIVPYGEPTDVKDWAMKAQLVNYEQYRALMEGFSSHMWEWYTGLIIWKTQNPWTSMRGQMYDYYLDPNAALYGCRTGSEMVHIMCNPVTGRVMIVNNSFDRLFDVMVVAKFYDIEGNETMLGQEFAYVDESCSKKIFSVRNGVERLSKERGGFLYLELQDREKNVLSRNIYWKPDANGKYSGLNEMGKAELGLSTKKVAEGKIEVTLTNEKSNPVAFFNRIAVVDAKTKERILPAFYDDNYLSVLPGGSRTVTVEFVPEKGVEPMITVSGWNVELTQSK